MTEMLKNEFSRTAFLKGGGALIVGFSTLGAGLAGKAHAADSPYASNGPYNQFQVDSWITIHANNTASIKTGGVRQGTGSDTGLLMIAGEELDMAMSQLIFIEPDTNVVPQTGAKTASNTILRAGPGIRAAAAWARQALLGLASTQLGMPVSALSVSKGVVSGGGRSVTYGDLLGGKLFNVQMPASYNMTPTNTGSSGFTGGIGAGVSPAKPTADYKLVGTHVPAIDIPDIASGKTTYIQNVRVPGMLHGRIVRPRGQALYGFGAPIVSVDERSIRHIPGARVVRKQDFLGVVAPDEYAAIQAAALLKVKWADPPKALPGHGNEFQGLRALDSAGKTIQSYTANAGDVNRALASATHVVSASYGWPTNVHTPLGTCCAVADATAHGVRIFVGTQGVYRAREAVATGLGLPVNRVRVTGVAMGGSFGPGQQYNDTALSAALMSQAVGAPVRLQLMRWDEIGWTENAAGSLIDIRAGVDASGNLVAFEETKFYPEYQSSTIETASELTGTAIPPTSIGGSAQTSKTLSAYRVANQRHLLKSLPTKGNWIKMDWFRAGSRPHSVHAGEQAIDELAHAAKLDPVAFRRQNVTDGAMRQPLLAVLNAVTAAAKWQPGVAASNLSNATIVSGRGIAWSSIARGAAAIADIEVNKKTGKITVKHVYQAFSAGLSVHPGGVENQMVGGSVQNISRLLTEQLRFGRSNVTSSDFVTYPLLRFRDAPKVTTIVLQERDVQPTGVGEPVSEAPAAAVANAFFDATGVRMRTAPFTPARVRAALKAAGVA